LEPHLQLLHKEFLVQNCIHHVVEIVKQVAPYLPGFISFCCALQKLEGDIARWQEEVPADQAAAEAAGQALEAAEAKLESLQEGIKDEVEAHHQALNKVRVCLCVFGDFPAAVCGTVVCGLD
jgi:hypothetical protein